MVGRGRKEKKETCQHYAAGPLEEKQTTLVRTDTHTTTTYRPLFAFGRWNNALHDFVVDVKQTGETYEVGSHKDGLDDQ